MYFRMLRGIWLVVLFSRCFEVTLEVTANDLQRPSKVFPLFIQTWRRLVPCPAFVWVVLFLTFHSIYLSLFLLQTQRTQRENGERGSVGRWRHTKDT